MSPRQRNGTNPNVTPAVPLESHSSLHVLFLPHGDTPPAPPGASLTPPCLGFLVLRPQRGGPQCRGRQQPARRAPHPPPRRTPLQVTAEGTSRVSVPLAHSHGRCGEQASDGPPDYPNSPPSSCGPRNSVPSLVRSFRQQTWIGGLGHAGRHAHRGRKGSRGTRPGRGTAGHVSNYNCDKCHEECAACGGCRRNARQRGASPRARREVGLCGRRGRLLLGVPRALLDVALARCRPRSRPPRRPGATEPVMPPGGDSETFKGNPHVSFPSG